MFMGFFRLNYLFHCVSPEIMNCFELGNSFNSFNLKFFVCIPSRIIFSTNLERETRPLLSLIHEMSLLSNVIPIIERVWLIIYVINTKCYILERSLNRRLRMKNELEIQIMNTLFMAHENENRPYLREYEIASRLKIKQSNLKRVLPRLIKRGWVEIKNDYSFSGLEPGGITYHLFNTENIDIPKEAYNPYYKKKIVTVPIEYVKKFQSRILGLKRIKNKYDFVSDEKQKEEVTLKSILENLPKKQRTKEEIKGRFKGRQPEWQKILTEGIPKKYTFYRMVYYPFLTRKITIGENSFEKFNVPKGKKRIWFKAAKEMRNEIKDKRSSLEILFSQNKIR